MKLKKKQEGEKKWNVMGKNEKKKKSKKALPARKAQSP
jgi:hypothetical protein